MGTAVAGPGRPAGAPGGATAAWDLVAQTDGVIRTVSGLRGWREWTSRAVFGLRQADRAHLDRLHEAWLSRGTPWSLNSHVVDRFFVFAGYPARYAPVRVTGTEDPATADQRWHAVITSLLEG
ncbi:hypothetical protein [Streptomyces sp. NPDC044948]|uniref:hypothetical protein n=1 Tax=Streptomyces sp. NPDC044948 TaxID=3157092 RepID=UPI0033DB6BF5